MHVQPKTHDAARPHATASSSAAPTHNNELAGSSLNLSGASAALLGAAFVLVLFIAWLNARRPPQAFNADDDQRAMFFQSATWRFVQTTIIGLLGIAAVWSALPTGPSALTVTLLILIIMVTLVPVVEKVAFPGSGGGIDLVKQKQLQESTKNLGQEATQSQVVIAAAAQMIAEYQSTLLDARTTRAGDLGALSDLSTRILQDATPTLATLIVPQTAKADGTPGVLEPMRISAWIQTQKGTSLRCCQCWPEDKEVMESFIDLSDRDVTSGVFVTGEARNLKELAPTLRPPKGSSGGLHGILILPMYSNGRIVGLVQVERARLERFEPVEVAMARALAALYSSALVLPTEAEQR